MPSQEKIKQRLKQLKEQLKKTKNPHAAVLLSAEIAKTKKMIFREHVLPERMRSHRFF